MPERPVLSLEPRPAPVAILAPSVCAEEGSSSMSPADLTLALMSDMPIYDASALTGKAGQARIVLGEQIYTLRITRAGKLILTK